MQGDLLDTLEEEQHSVRVGFEGLKELQDLLFVVDVTAELRGFHAKREAEECSGKAAVLDGFLRAPKYSKVRRELISEFSHLFNVGL